MRSALAVLAGATLACRAVVVRTGTRPVSANTRQATLLLTRVYRHRAGRGPGREFILGDADLPPALQAEREALGEAFTFLESGGG